ncbi:PqiC family protein [Modicisalibacter xianhensis]|uniref:ABC-type transport auxiliary lipoprotein component domain-containing protein n=1 Tax=Modicisalibacter xianhensis TaxID=442341 RepID=A0A1I3A2K6_9GAMM|nr:ABC-type transport auxiliary lipoprotein family protein [Halomonas xianhensis]SFH44106.1 hypothetical protein SAMN04487959_10485 [Halomonas xianhensis]
MRVLSLCLLVIWLAGCATGGGGSSLERYTLPPGAYTADVTEPSPQRTLIIDGVQVANYLSGQGIVLQRNDVLLHQASSHLWAEDLGRQLHRGLRQRLAERLPDTRVLNGGNASDAWHLRVEVDEFQGRYDGMAVAGGRWQLRDADGDILAIEPFSASVPLDSDGYPALVRALGKSWDEVALDMAQRIRTL